MRTGKKLEMETLRAEGNGAGPFRIAPQTKVADVLAHYPQSLPIFLRHGFGPLSNPVLRRTMARVVTVEQACRREGVALDKFLSEPQGQCEMEEVQVPVSISPRKGRALENSGAIL